MKQEEARERSKRRDWARRAIEEEQRRRINDQFLSAMINTQWFNDTISSFCEQYEVVCPYSSQGCRHICLRHELEDHLEAGCKFGGKGHEGEEKKKKEDMAAAAAKYEVICPNSVLGCQHSCSRKDLQQHLQVKYLMINHQ